MDTSQTSVKSYNVFSKPVRNHEDMNMYEFTEEDLKHNKPGQLSPGQLEWLKTVARVGILHPHEFDPIDKGRDCSAHCGRSRVSDLPKLP